jgi:hypothetical protein
VNQSQAWLGHVDLEITGNRILTPLAGLMLYFRRRHAVKRMGRRSANLSISRHRASKESSLPKCSKFSLIPANWRLTMLFDGGCIFLKCWEAFFRLDRVYFLVSDRVYFGMACPTMGADGLALTGPHLPRFGRIHSLYHAASDIKRSRSSHDPLSEGASHRCVFVGREIRLEAGSYSTTYNAMRQILLPPSRHPN